MSSAPFAGVYSALVTPMTKSGDIDFRKLAAFSQYLVDAGVHGLTPLGSTGEFYALDPDERAKVIEVVLDAVGNRVPVVPGTNASSTREVIDFSKEAEKMGCPGVMLAAPYYSLPTEDELFAHFKAVNDAIGVPIMLYNYPGRTGVDMKPEFVARLAKLKNVRYIKESTGEMPRIAMLKRLCGNRLGIFCGCDTIALQSFLMGATGWTGGVVNALPRCHSQLFELALAGDFGGAAALYEKFLPVLELMEGGGRYTCWVKAACKLMGHDVGEPRGPLGPATTQEIAALKKALKGCASIEK
jgi:4-hydroxy-tetrahydrodipicolinate synthase